MSFLSFICYLIIAAVCAIIAERVTPGVIPGGFVTSAIVGVIGAWVGGVLLGSFGPDLAGISLLPCIIGSAVLIFGLSLFSRLFKQRSNG
jgi:uncharacterized membrane protein YeaQ/YmgE (transglycosylase-associated protein family)